MTIVVDASALLAFLQNESGADVVEAALLDDCRCGAANWSEVAQKALAAERDWSAASALLLSYGLHIEPVLAADAEWAARRWNGQDRLSLADRLCLALGARLDAAVLTADRAWGSQGLVRQIR